MDRCGRRDLGAVQAGVGIAFSAISMPAARSTGSLLVGGRGSSSHLRPSSGSRVTHGRSLQRETMRVMDQAIADRIGDTGLADRQMPGRRWQLAGHQRGPAITPIFDDFQEIASLGIGE